MVHGQPAGAYVFLNSCAVTCSDGILCGRDVEVLYFLCVYFKNLPVGADNVGSVNLAYISKVSCGCSQQCCRRSTPALWHCCSSSPLSSRSAMPPNSDQRWSFASVSLASCQISSSLLPSLLPSPLMMSFIAAHLMLCKSLRQGVGWELTPVPPHLRPCFLVSSVLSLSPSSPPVLHFLSH